MIIIIDKNNIGTYSALKQLEGRHIAKNIQIIGFDKIEVILDHNVRDIYNKAFTKIRGKSLRSEHILDKISTYINTKKSVCLSVCLFVCSGFSRPFRNRLGNPLAQTCLLLL